MEQLFEQFFKNGLKPLSLFPDTSHLQAHFTSSDLSALVLIKIHGQLTMSEMAKHLGAPLSTVTSISKRLVRKGSIYREKSAQDQRIIVNRLTKEGDMIAEEVLGLLKESFYKIEEALTPEELQQFFHLALKVAKALQQEPTRNRENKSKKVRSIEIE
ncbi:MarR family winged helix-turn-helix transcriptional regulator [Sporosarcina sp. Te-1]|uniref:MarR family winged helix-turn-helix transcriptional regulator n=1 Tax=Sporosarcina sp. Te-1 TaxID=2818390 RepID=UPI001A9CB904|nr:MarR family transcriptional regulator [Sporosarcina sp. Te-1]QTD39534.1 MarR family transcriptional regulator [Sporosarcina sp. Te-1]